MKKGKYYLHDLERLGASFIYEKKVNKKLFGTHYAGVLMMNEKAYRAEVTRNLFEISYLSGIVEDSQTNHSNRDEIHKCVMERIASGKFPEFEKAAVDRSALQILFGSLFCVCLVFSVYFGVQLYEFPCRNAFISFILPFICWLISIRSYIVACRI